MLHSCPSCDTRMCDYGRDRAGCRLALRCLWDAVSYRAETGEFVTRLHDMARIAQKPHKQRAMPCAVFGRTNRQRLPPFLIAPMRFSGGCQHDICNLKGKTAYSQPGRRNSYLRFREAKRVIRNLSPGICFCVWAPRNLRLRSRPPKPAFANRVGPTRHLRSGSSNLTFRVSRPGTRFSDSGSRYPRLRFARPKVEKWKSEPETGKVKSEGRFWKSGIRRPKSENRLPAIESVKVTWRPRICKSECHDMSLAFRVPAPKVCNCDSARRNLQSEFRPSKCEKWITPPSFVKATSGRQNRKSGCQPMALVFGEPTAKTCNVRTGGVKAQKQVGPLGIAKVLHGISLGAINNAAFRRTETKHAGIVRVEARLGRNRSTCITIPAYAGYMWRRS